MQRLSYMSNPKLQSYRYSSVVDIFRENASKFPTKEILIHRRENGNRISITNEDLEAKSTQLAKFLYNTGIKRGTSVALLGPNTIEWVVGELAILKTGAVSVHLNLSTNAAEDAMDILTKENCRQLMIDPGIDMEMEQSITILLEKVLQRNNEIFDKILLVQLRGIPGYENIVSFNDIVLMNLDVELPFIFPEDPAIVFTTSGSTGNPKNIQHSHFALANFCNTMDELFLISSGKLFNDRPFSWIMGAPTLFLIQNTVRVFTDTTVGIRGTNPEYIWNAIKDEGCSCSFISPFLLLDLCKLKERKNDNFLLQHITTGGQIIDDRYRKAIGLVCNELHIAYGSTEGGSAIHSINKSIPIKTGICGKPAQGVEYKLINFEKDTTLLGQHGEVCFRSLIFSKGFFNDHTINGKLFINNGWMRMGDIGFIDENGDLVITGRSKDIISRGTRKLLPSMIEERIKKMPGIKEAVVVPVPDERLYEEVCVCFTTDTDKTTEDVRTFCDEIFMKDETLDGKGESPTYFLRIDEMPQLMTGKVDKNSLKKIASLEFGSS